MKVEISDILSFGNAPIQTLLLGKAIQYFVASERLVDDDSGKILVALTRVSHGLLYCQEQYDFGGFQ